MREPLENREDGSLVLVFDIKENHMSCLYHLSRGALTCEHQPQSLPIWTSWNMPTMHAAMMPPRQSAHSACVVHKA